MVCDEEIWRDGIEDEMGKVEETVKKVKWWEGETKRKITNVKINKLRKLKKKKEIKGQIYSERLKEARIRFRKNKNK